MSFSLQQRRVGPNVRLELKFGKKYLWIATDTSTGFLKRPSSEIRVSLFKGLLNPIMLSSGTINPEAFLAVVFISLGGARYRVNRNCSGLFEMATQCNDIHPDFQKIILYFLRTECLENCGFFQDYFEQNFGDYSLIQEFYEFLKNSELEKYELFRL
jgi:hypothetical protein